jgi:hypothetical protein
MLNSFENDPRRKQEIKGRQFADEIYRDVFGGEITRFEKEDNYLLDRKFAIDVQVTTPVGLVLVGQEKFLSHEYIGFKTITIEYMQDPTIADRGDWFKMAVQFYITSYFNKSGSGFDLWVIADWAQVVIGTLNGNIVWAEQRNKDGKAKANFKHTKMMELPDSCIIAASWKSNTPF